MERGDRGQGKAKQPAVRFQSSGFTVTNLARHQGRENWAGRGGIGACRCSQLPPAKALSDRDRKSASPPRPISSLEGPAGGPQHLPSTGPGTWQEPFRTQKFLGRKEP